jgi:serine/threonine protein kinase
MEYMGGGAVKDILEFTNVQLHERQIATILFGVLKGLCFLHSKGILHRDIKAGNVLLTNQGDIKLGSFSSLLQLTYCP